MKWSVVLSALAIACLVASTAIASLASLPQWVIGEWNCVIDGRPAHMQWRIENRVEEVRRGDAVSVSTAAVAVGSFWDNGGVAARLTPTSNQVEGSLRFRHQDGNYWQLWRQTDGSLSGYTTWSNARYPLNCHRPAAAAPPRAPYGSDIQIQNAPLRPVGADPNRLRPRQ